MKKVLIGIIVLLAIIVAGLMFVWSNLDGIVKDAIQTYGSEATKTQVTVSKVHLELESGKASISGLNVGNPKGFTDPNLFELGNITVKVDTSSINSNPILIDEIIIHSPSVVYEINKDGLSNVDALKKNLGIKESSSKSASKGEEVKMIIRKLVVEGTKAKVKIAALGGMEQSVNLPRIQLTDVGKKSGGATAAEVAQLLSSKMIGNVKGAVSKLGVGKYLGKSADMFKKGASSAVDAVGNAAGTAGDTIKGLFGK
jgi:hypothetical protein